MKTKNIIFIFYFSLLIIAFTSLCIQAKANVDIEDISCAEDAMSNINDPSLFYENYSQILGEYQETTFKLFNLPEHTCTDDRGGFFSLNTEVAVSTINNVPLQNRWVKSVEDGPVTINIEFEVDRDDFEEQGYSYNITYFSVNGPKLITNTIFSFDGNFSFEWNPRLASATGFIKISIAVNGLGPAGEDPQAWFFYVPTTVEGPTSLTAPVIDVTQTPIIPRMVIYKPPGDMSSSSFTAETEICREFTKTMGKTNTFSNNSDLTVGYAGSVGAVVEVDVEIGVTGSGGFESSDTQTSTKTAETCNSITSTFATSELATNNAADSDLIIGMSKQMMIAKGNFTSVNDTICELETKPQLYVYYVGTGTILVGQTRSQILGQMQSLQDAWDDALALGSNISEEDLKIALEKLNQLKVYQQLMNQLSASEAAGFAGQSFTFPQVAAGTPETRDFGMTATQSISFEYESVATKTAGLEGFASVAGNGARNQSTWSWTETHGSGTSTTETNTEIISYTVQDEEDNIGLTRFTNPRFGSPMFKINPTSATSCPYEGGIRRDQPRIEANPDEICPVVIANSDNLIPYEIELELCNDAAEERTYRLLVVGNVNNATVKEGGITLGSGQGQNTPHTIAASSCKTVISSIQANPNTSHAFDYVLMPECEGNPENSEGVSDILSISFVPGAIEVDTDNDLIISCDLCPNTKNTALDFDGSNDYITIPHDNKFDIIEFMFIADIKIENQNGRNVIFTKGVNNIEYEFYITGSDHPTVPNSLAVDIPGLNETYLSGVRVPVNTWTRISLSLDIENNNVLIGRERLKFQTRPESGGGFGDGPSLADRPIVSEDFHIGNGFKGQMDEVMFWNKDLGGVQFDETRQKLSGMETGLLVYYNFDEGLPCTSNPGISEVINQVPTGANGIMNNFGTLNNSCTSNWTSSENGDVDNDGIGDVCDPAQTCFFNDTDGDEISDCNDSCNDERDRSLYFLSGAYIAVPHHQDFNFTDGDFAFESWIDAPPASFEQVYTILSKGTGSANQTQYEFVLDGFDRVGLYLSDGTNGEWQYSEDGIATGDVWTHVAVSVDNSGAAPIATFYLDGIENGVKTYTTLGTLYNDSNNPLYIGKGVNSIPAYGSYDEIAIWDRTLSGTDIAASMSANHTGREANLVAYYGFNETNECHELTDIANGHNGTLINFALQINGCPRWWIAGHNQGQCGPMFCPSAIDTDSDAILDCEDLCLDIRDTSLDFNDENTSDYIEVPHAPEFNLTDGDFAFEAWINLSSGNYKTILSKGNGSNAITAYIFGIMSDDDTFFDQPGKLGLYLTDGSSAEWQFSETAIPQDTWTHVAVSVDNSGASPIATFYLNGLENGVKSYTTLGTLYNADTNPLFIGRQGWGCQCNYFDGKMDELAIWSKTLSTLDLAESMSTPYEGTETDLVAYYDFNDADACVTNTGNTTLVDIANSHNGVLQNFDLGSFCKSNWAAGHNSSSCEPTQCPSDVQLNGFESFAVTYESATYIESNQLINSGEIKYSATTEITLTEGFEVKAGAELQAFIDGCN